MLIASHDVHGDALAHTLSDAFPPAFCNGDLSKSPAVERLIANAPYSLRNHHLCEGCSRETPVSNVLQLFWKDYVH